MLLFGKIFPPKKLLIYLLVSLFICIFISVYWCEILQNYDKEQVGLLILKILRYKYDLRRCRLNDAVEFQLKNERYKQFDYLIK
jgi:hypothetical protein